MEKNQKSITAESLSNKKEIAVSLNKVEEKQCNLTYESDSSSEFEFNYKKHIVDSFEIKNKGLFKLSFVNNKTDSNLILDENEDITNNVYNENESKSDNINNEMIQPEFLMEDKKENVDDNKDEIIINLKKEIDLLTNKLMEKSNKIEAVQKDNFQLEQIYKNKYYTDIKKEKKLANDIFTKNDKLLKKLYYYQVFFQQLKKKIQCILNIILTHIQHNKYTETLNFIFEDMKNILVLLDSIECNSTIDNGNISEEKNEKPNIYNFENIQNKNKKNEKIGNIYIDKEIDLITNDLFLKHSKKVNNKNKTLSNSPIKKRSTIEHNYRLKKSHIINSENRKIKNGVNSKNKNNLASLPLHEKQIPNQTYNIFDLLKKTRKINYLLRSTLNMEGFNNCNNSQKRNKSYGNCKKTQIKVNKTKECMLQNENKSDYAVYNCLLKKNTLNNFMSNVTPKKKHYKK